MSYKNILAAPMDYWKLSNKEKENICNGAGPRGFGYLVPDTIWGLNITEAANIHDYMYHIGKTINDKLEADNTFLDNLIRIIEVETKYNWLKKLRCHRAKIMYEAVVHFGGPAFEKKG